ncbi:hypothetical protein V6N13_033131 [Hibiscus sabdariffa]
MLLEDLDWSYLKEIFREVGPWSESLQRSERATWLEISGVPLHCWNHTTLKRVAELWGTFEAFGENASHLLDCEKVTILVITNRDKKIEEVIEIEVDNMIYNVHVMEIGFSDNSAFFQSSKVKQSLRDEKTNQGLESKSESSSIGSDKSSSAGCRSVDRMEDGALNENCFGTVFNINEVLPNTEFTRKLGEEDCWEALALVLFKSNDVDLTWVEVAEKEHAAGNGPSVIESIDRVGYFSPVSSDHVGDKDITFTRDLVHVSPRALDDVRDMGLSPITTTHDKSPVKCKS